MKINGKVITQDQYVEMEKNLNLPKDLKNLTKTQYDVLGREINNPTPIFLNDPDDMDKPMTINGKVLRILRLKQMAHLENQIESEEEMNDFPEPEDLPETPYQVIDLKDPDDPNEDIEDLNLITDEVETKPESEDIEKNKPVASKKAEGAN